MHRRRWITALALCGLVLGASLAAAESHKEGAKTTKTPSQEEMMAAMQKLAQPGPEHESLSKCVGTWKAVSKAWAGPGEPTTTEGMADFRMILGGRFLEERFSGTFMGQPFEGVGLFGYDNALKKHSMFWVDNSGTGMMQVNGNYDPAKKVVTWKSSMPGMDGKPMDARMTLELPDENTQIFTMYTTEKKKETKWMEVTYTRQGSASN